MATPETRPSILGRAARWLGSVSSSMDRSPETQTFRANAEITRKVAEAKRRMATSKIRLDPQILHLASFSVIILAAEQMEERGNYPGARFDLMKDAAEKSRTIAITRHFADFS